MAGCIQPGSVLGKYVILDKLGQGGMGVVFKARHTVIGRTVALKVLPLRIAAQSGALPRFRREVQAAARLVHPNIVTAYDADEDGGRHFLVMECIEGENLSNTVKKFGPLALDRALNYVLQAASGLRYAHQQGVIHRDIKPSNLLVDRIGTLKILDMGLARIDRALDEPEANRESPLAPADGELTGVGTILGTVDYISPEQAESTKDADQRSDIYSLGCSFYFLLHGRAMFGPGSITKRLVAHRQTPAPALAGARDDVPECLNQVFQKMVAKNPQERFQTMHEVLSALESCTAEARAIVSRAAVAGGDTGLFTAAGLTLPAPFTVPRFETAPGDTDVASFPTSTVTIQDVRRPRPASASRTRALLVWFLPAAAIVLGILGAWYMVVSRHPATVRNGRASQAQRTAPGSGPLPPDRLGSTAAWESAFDGQSLAGWTADRESGLWKVEQGALVAVGGDSRLYYTAALLHDFEFEADVNCPKTSIGAVHVRALFGRRSRGRQRTRGFEIALCGRAASGAPITGSLVGLATARPTTTPVSDSFHLHISAIGRRIVVRIDGRVATDYRLADSGPKSGHIVLESRKGRLTFKNLRVKGRPNAYTISGRR